MTTTPETLRQQLETVNQDIERLERTISQATRSYARKDLETQLTNARARRDHYLTELSIWDVPDDASDQELREMLAAILSEIERVEGLMAGANTHARVTTYPDLDGLRNTARTIQRRLAEEELPW